MSTSGVLHRHSVADDSALDGHSARLNPNPSSGSVTSYSLLDGSQNPNTFKHKILHRYAKLKRILYKFSTFIGPGLMVSVAYMDPGNYATGVTAGALNRFSLLFFILLSTIMALFLQSICIKLGSVTGHDLARSSREHLPKWLNYILWFLAECAIISTDVAEVIGSAIALNILIKIPLPAGVAITIADVFFVLIAYRNDTSSARFVRYFEYAVALLILAVCVCFAVELAHIPTRGMATVREIFRGYAPSKEMVEGSGLTIATSIIGSTVMIHSLYLGSGIVQPRLREYDVQHGHVQLLDIYHDDDDEDYDVQDEKSEKVSKKIRIRQQEREAEYFYNEYKPSYQAIKYSLNYSLAELFISLFTVAIFVNSAILIVAGSTLNNTPQAVNADLYTIHDLLSTSLAPIVGTVFMLALLFSGQSAGIVCTIAGQIVSEGHVNWTVKPWLRRIITRAIAIVPCMVISLCIGKGGLNIALNISQVIISILLPPLTGPLIYFTCSKKIMRVEIPLELRVYEEGVDDPEDDKIKYKYMHNGWIVTIFLVLIWLFISGLNIYAIYSMAKDGVAA